MGSVGVSALVFRDAEKRDLPTILELSQATWNRHHEFSPDHFTNWETFAKALRDRFERSTAQQRSAVMLVAEQNGAVVGYISAVRETISRPDGKADHIALIDDIEVQADHRRTGIGLKLLQRMRDRLTAEGATALRAVIWGFNTESLTFFTKAGLTLHFHGVSQRLSPPVDAPPTSKVRRKAWWKHALSVMLGVYLTLLIVERLQLMLNAN